MCFDHLLVVTPNTTVVPVSDRGTSQPSTAVEPAHTSSPLAFAIRCGKGT
jgi:hypothetical protein